MPRVYAFVYAVGDGRSPGEIKIGNTSAVSHEAAITQVTSRYKMVYGRCLEVFKVIPVALPKMQAEDIVKDLLATYHSCGELYDLPTADTAETQHFLDLAYADLEVPFADAHFVDKPSPADRKMELERERLQIVEREADRISRKRARVEERAAEDERVYRERRAQRINKRSEKEEKKEQKRKSRVVAAASALSQPADDVTAWANAHLETASSDLFVVLNTAFRQFHKDTGRHNIGKSTFSACLKQLFPHSFEPRKRLPVGGMCGVFMGVHMRT